MAAASKVGSTSKPGGTADKLRVAVVDPIDAPQLLSLSPIGKGRD
jgi:hypothetical protein